MKKSAYERPDKPLRMIVKRSTSSIADIDIKKPLNEPLAVSAATECHVTPVQVVNQMMDYINPYGSILEPSAGTGNILNKILTYYSSDITAVELNQQLAQHLTREFADRINLVNADFLEWSKLTEARFDCIYMNPPFKTYAKHIDAAYHLLKSNSDIMAIVPASCQFGNVVAEFDSSLFASAKVYTKLIHIDKA